MLEPGTGEVREIPATFAAFHEDELVEYGDGALARGFFALWRRNHSGSLPLGPEECVGYGVPLFAGGTDTADNLEISDLEVYWSVCSQLFLATRGLPDGTPITGVAGTN